MKSKKGLFLLIFFILTIIVFFFTLFFVHENTLENGILFNVSFQYENGKEIIYNFYNQSGKIEKVEKENKFLLEKTDYNTAKLFRKLTKKIKATKEPSKEEGITLYHVQEKKYYFIPYNSSEAEELISFIVDGYIRSELKRVANKKVGTELYVYQNEDEIKGTSDGSTDNIIHNYRCENEKCKIIYVGNNDYEMVLWDNDYYYYNYTTRSKEKLNVEEDFDTATFLKLDNRILGLDLQNKNKEYAYYDLAKKEIVIDYEKSKHSLINEELILKQSNNDSQYELIVWNIKEEKKVFEKIITEEKNIAFSMQKINQEENTYLLGKTKNKKTTYQILDKNGNFLLEEKNVEKNDKNELMIKENNITKYYDTKGNFLREEKEEQKK